MSLADYDIERKLGQGTFGKVYKARRRKDGQVVVLKEIPLMGLSKEEQEETLNEVDVMENSDHFNIIKYYGSFLDNKTLYIVMEHAASGDLQEKIRVAATEGKFIEEDLIWNYLIQIAQGLKYLHEKRILHRDIKPQNIFLDEEDNVKIGDMGLGRILSSQSSFACTGVGTPLYFSPELCKEQPYNSKSDVWAFGCLMYELTTLQPPFRASNQIALARKIVTEQPEPIPRIYTTELQFLITKMLEKDPVRRPDIVQIMNYSAVRIRIEKAKIKHKEAKLKQYYEELEENLKVTYEEKLHNLEAKMKDISSLEVEYRNENERLQKKVKSLQNRIKELESELDAETDQELEQLKIENSRLKSELKSTKQNEEKMAERISNLEVEARGLRDYGVQEYEERERNINKRDGQLKEREAILMERESRLETRLNEREKELQSLEEVIGEKEEELRVEKSYVEKYRMEVEEKERETNVERNLISSMLEEIQRKENELNRWSETLAAREMTIMNDHEQKKLELDKWREELQLQSEELDRNREELRRKSGTISPSFIYSSPLTGGRESPAYTTTSSPAFLEENISKEDSTSQNVKGRNIVDTESEDTSVRKNLDEAVKEEEFVFEHVEEGEIQTVENAMDISVEDLDNTHEQTVKVEEEKVKQQKKPEIRGVPPRVPEPKVVPKILDKKKSRHDPRRRSVKLNRGDQQEDSTISYQSLLSQFEEIQKELNTSKAGKQKEGDEQEVKSMDSMSTVSSEAGSPKRKNSPPEKDFPQKLRRGHRSISEPQSPIKDPTRFSPAKLRSPSPLKKFTMSPDLKQLKRPQSAKRPASYSGVSFQNGQVVLHSNNLGSNFVVSKPVFTAEELGVTLPGREGSDLQFQAIFAWIRLNSSFDITGANSSPHSEEENPKILKERVWDNKQRRGLLTSCSRMIFVYKLNEGISKPSKFKALLIRFKNETQFERIRHITIQSSDHNSFVQHFQLHLSREVEEFLFEFDSANPVDSVFIFPYSKQLMDLTRSETEQKAVEHLRRMESPLRISELGPPGRIPTPSSDRAARRKKSSGTPKKVPKKKLFHEDGNESPSSGPRGRTSQEPAEDQLVWSSEQKENMEGSFSSEELEALEELKKLRSEKQSVQ